MTHIFNTSWVNPKMHMGEGDGGGGGAGGGGGS